MDKKVLIVMMPWASIDFPGMGPSLVHSVLNQKGYQCEMLYANLAFSQLVETDPFIINQISKLPICEIAFSPFYFDMEKAVAVDTLEKHVEGASYEESDKRNPRSYYENIVNKAEQCLDQIFETTDWEAYDIVGFSVMMQQTVASLALSRKIKKAYPQKKILFGGPSTSAPMGGAMIEAFPEIDYILQGEVDATIAPFVESVRNMERDIDKVPGVLYRSASGEIIKTKHNAPFFKLDDLPTPDYAPYFSQLKKYGINEVEPYIQIETSRGCWWGEKHHCTFCGIEDEILKYRTKSDDKVIQEIIDLSSKFHGLEFFPVDSIISHGAFKSLLPKIEVLRDSYGYDLSFFFECKSNLKTESVKRLRKAGVRSVQPGLESFSDHVLSLMDKGTTGARQVQCLKLCSERDIVVNWNLIYENIGEKAEDYQVMIDLIPFITHLPPLHGEGMIPVQLNRFAPYHNTPEKFGISNITPKPYYQKIFPDESIDLDRMAFYFDFNREHKITDEMRALYKELKRLLVEWRNNHKPQMLTQRRGPGFIEITDYRYLSYKGKRANKKYTFLIEGVEAEMFSACDEVIKESRLVRMFSKEKTEEEVKAFIDEMVSNYQIYRSESNELINLPLRSDIPNSITKNKINERKHPTRNLSVV